MKLRAAIIICIISFLSTSSFAAQVCTTTTIPGGGNNDFDGISGISDTNVISVGENGNIYQWDGTSWTQMTSPTNEDIADIFMLPNGTAYAVGDQPNNNDPGTILYFNGTAWSSVTAGAIPDEDLTGVWAYSSTEVYVVGDNGSILTYNGTTWSDISGSLPTPNNEDLEKIWGNSTHVYALDRDGVIFTYNRSSGLWSRSTLCEINNRRFRDLWVGTSGNVFVVAENNGNGYIYEYNGSTCSLVFTASDELRGIDGSNTTGEIYAVGDNGVVVYFDGSTWSESTQNSNEDIRDTWVSNTGNAYHAAQGGEVTTCIEDCSDPDPSTITIPAGQFNDGNPYDVSSMFTTTGDVGSFEYRVSIGGGSGTVALLDNGGTNWNAHSENDPAPTSHAYTAPAGNDRAVVVVISGEGPNPTINGVTVGGSAATLIDTVTRDNSSIWTYYRLIGSSASTTGADIAVNWNNDPNTDAAINAATYSGVIQTTGTGAGFAINDVATGTASSGTTTSGAVTNVAGGRVIYAVNMNSGDGNNQITTGTSTAWTFTETWDVYVLSNRTAAGHSDTAAGTATVSVDPAPGTDDHNRSSMVVFSFNPAAASTVCTDWTSSASIPATTAGGSLCGDYTDGGTYTLDVRGTDPDCGGQPVTTTPVDFIWNRIYVPLASYAMEQASWSGTAGEVVDSMGTYHGTAIGPTNLPFTTSVSPAIATDPGTCTYGDFDDSDDYIEVPGFPNLTTDFTITAWIRTHSNSSSGQRIFADDENNSGGYSLSLGDGGTGRLRFYSRAVNPIIMDTGNIIANDTWYFVAGVADTVNSTRTIYIYNASFNQLALVTGTYTGSWGTDNGLASIGGETNLGETGNRFDGNLDEVHIYTEAVPQAGIEQIMRETHSCPAPASVNHYEIEHDGTAINCEPENITIKACEDAACSTLYAGNVDLTLTANADSFPLSFSGGTTTYALRHITPEVVTLGITAPTPAPTTATTCLETATPAASCNITFYESGFKFLIYPDDDHNNTPDAGAETLNTQISGKRSDQGWNDQVLRIQAVRTDTGECVAALNSPLPRNTQMRIIYVNPAAPTGSPALQVNGKSITTTWTDMNDMTDLTFTAGLSNDSYILYPDAGQLSLEIRHDTDGDAIYEMLGMNNPTLTVRPFAFSVNDTLAYVDSATVCGSCQTAGQNFQVDVTAFAMNAVTEDNGALAGSTANNGIPDVFEDDDPTAIATYSNNDTLVGNPATPNFAASATLSRVFILPPGGSAGTFTSSAVAIAGGTGSAADANWTEVGIIALAAQTNDYLTVTDADVTGRSNQTGRFIPADFNVTSNPASPTLADSCLAGGFSYLGQPFNYTINPVITITARNSVGATTSNYDCGTFWKLPDPYTLNYTFTDSSGAGPALTPATGTASPAALDTTDCNGSISVTIADSLSYARPLTTDPPQQPFAAAIDLAATAAQFTDTDGVCFGAGCQSFSRAGITGANMRHGRSTAGNAYGPETATAGNPLLMPISVDYYDNSPAWVTNTDDSCTSFTYVITPNGTITTASSPVSPITTASGLGNLSIWPTGVDPDGIAGGSVDLTYDFPLWLDDFAVEAFFGIYRGNDRIINWREIVR